MVRTVPIGSPFTIERVYVMCNNGLDDWFAADYVGDATFAESRFLSSFGGVRHVFTSAGAPGIEERFSVSLNGAFPRDGVLAHRQAVAAYLGVDAGRAVYMRQCHGAGVCVVGGHEIGRGAWEYTDGLDGCDAVVTDRRGVLLVAQGADCLPVLLYDAEHGAIGAAHAGWKGTVLGVVTRALETMRETFGTRPAEVYALLGPCIGPAAFEVGCEVAEQFRMARMADAVLWHGAEGKAYIDLQGANRLQLEGWGVLRERIFAASLCTYTLWPRFFSARRGDMGRQMGGIVLV